MNFSGRVTQLTDRPPEGWPKRISPKRYAGLNENRQYYYSPIYAKYKTKKYREYETCDLGHSHYQGWAIKRIPIGEPVRYEYHGAIMGRVVEDVLKSSVLASRIMGIKPV